MPNVQIDPHWLIARETNYVDHAPSAHWHAVNLAWSDAGSVMGEPRLRALHRALGNEYRMAPAHATAADAFPVATAEVTTLGLQLLEALVRKGKGPVLRFEYAQPLAPPRLPPAPVLTLPPGLSLPPTRKAPAASSLPGDDKPLRDVFAVIDHGCPFMHPLLRSQHAGRSRTRVRALWDQQGGAPVDPRTIPTGFYHGTQLTREQLEAVARVAGGDETRAYGMLGYRAMRLRQSHGAHALGLLLAPGGVRRAGESEPDVLFVQLPQDLLGAPRRAVLSRYVIDALQWLLLQCRPGERLILSLGEGSSQGPQDGSSLVEQALSAFVSAPPGHAGGVPGRNLHRVYVAAGNGHNEALHAKVERSEARRTASVGWLVPPANELPATVEIWLPTDASGTPKPVTVTVQGPDGRDWVSIGPVGDAAQVAHAPDAETAVVSAAHSSWSGEGCTLAIVRLAPTAASAGAACAPPGLWTIKLHSTRPISPAVHLSIGRNRQAIGFPLRTTQSTFVGDASRDLIGASTAGTLQGLATAQGVLAVGAARLGIKGDQPTDYSSRGPARDGRVKGPAVSVRCEDGTALPGRRSVGNGAGVVFRMNGTSVAAPMAARLDRGRDRPAKRRSQTTQPGTVDNALGEVLLDDPP